MAPRSALRINLAQLDADTGVSIVRESAERAVEEIMAPFAAFEDNLRRHYAQTRAVTLAPAIGILPIFRGDRLESEIKIHPGAPSEKVLFSLPEEIRKAPGTPATVTSFEAFQKNFKDFCGFSFQGFDWDNVIVAGGAVVDCLVTDPGHQAHLSVDEGRFHHRGFSPQADVDLFLHGLNEQQAIEKLESIEAFLARIAGPSVTVRTKNAVTICSRFPVRHVQVVLRLYENPSEVLVGFDVDCSAVAYDGSNVWATPRAVAAFCAQANRVDLSRRSPSYEHRLAKYARRGFEVFWDGLQRERVCVEQVQRAPCSALSGLAKLLKLESSSHHTESMSPCVGADDQKAGAEWVGEHISDYLTCSIPFGPQWDPDKIAEFLRYKDHKLNEYFQSMGFKVGSGHHHLFFLGNVADIVQACCPHCARYGTQPPIDDSGMASFRVFGPLKFCRHHPGRQTVGSFYPLTAEDWSRAAYEPEDAVHPTHSPTSAEAQLAGRPAPAA